MKSAGWSTLLLGTFLATAAGGSFVRAEDAGGTVPVERVLDAVAAAGATSSDEPDRSIDTGSIAVLEGPAKSGLVPLAPREARPLKDLSVPSEVKPSAAAKAVETPLEAEAARPAKSDSTGDAAKIETPKIDVPEIEATAPVVPGAAVSKAPAGVSPESDAPAVAVGGSGETAPVMTTPIAETVQPSVPTPAENIVATPSVPPQGEPIGSEAEHRAAGETPKADVSKVAEPKAEASTIARDAAIEGSATTVPSKTASTTSSSLETAPVRPTEAAKPDAPLTRSAETTGSTAAPAAMPTVVAPSPAAEAPTLTPREAEVAAFHAAELDADALKKVVEAHAVEAGSSDDRKDRAAIAAFYAQRAHQPLFVGTEDLTPRAKVAVEHFRAAAQDGLEPRDYALPAMRAATPEGRAEAEYSVAVTVLRYARHLQAGRFDPLRLSDLVTAKPTKPDPAVVLREVATGADVSAVLDAFAPPHEGYKRLKVELARLRGEVAVPVVRLPSGPVLKPGAKDARVAMLRERLGVSAVVSDAEVFDPSLSDLVKTFQKERGLSASGSLNRETVAALNDESRGSGDKIADVVVNMERWRWLPRDLGTLHVFVNIPDFHLDVMKNGKSIHHARVITGRPANQTPVFSETMKYVVVNPYWNVPQSIIQKEMLGKLQASAGQGLSSSFEVEVGNQTVDPATVDWNQVSARQVSIRQRPGDGNALGNIKFMFPNQHSVYIHDTSSRGLFAQSYRALSHGCVRVHEPFSFADAVLSQEPNGLGGAQLKKMLGGAEKEVSLKVQVPVHMAYFTVFVDDAGQVQTRRDVYGHDAKMKRILGL